VWQFSKRIGSSTYEFWRKGNQFNFNCSIEDAINTAKSELSKIKTTDSDTRDAVQRAEMSLNEGLKALSIRQKHIKIANRSDLSWATEKHYMANPLADGPEDEDEIARSEKEALKEQERAHAKKAPQHGGGGKFRKSRQDYYQCDYTDLSHIMILVGESGLLCHHHQCPTGSPDLACWGRVFVVVQWATSSPQVQHRQDRIFFYSLW